MTDKDGGQAFPTLDTSHVRDDYSGLARDNLHTKYKVVGGMSLRDWFAGQVLAECVEACNPLWDIAAERAYRIADAMLAERAK